MKTKTAAIAPGSTIHEVFCANVTRQPDTAAIINGSATVSYRELDHRVGQMSTLLGARGVKKGDRVAILSNARIEVAIVFLACARIGAIYVGLGTRLARPELFYIFSDSRPSLIFSVDELDGRRYAEIVQAAAVETGLDNPIIFSATSPGLAEEVLHLLDAAASTSDITHPSTGDPAVIIYTSGSTGAPKGALLSNENLIVSSTAFIEHSPLRSARAISQLPIDHVAFVMCEMAAILMAGGTMVQLPRFDPKLVLEAIERHRVTLMLNFPTMIQRLLDSGLMDNYDLTSLELVWWAGPLAPSSIAKVRKYSRAVAASYGMTEASGTISFTDENATDTDLSTTVGRPPPAIEVRIAHEGGDDAPGEIQLRGRQIMLGYWNRPEATQGAFTQDGWFRTGDLGIIEDEILSIVGRSKELIRSGGYNILPSEVEIALEEHADIVMAFVAGVPDPVYGEAVHAILHVREGAELEMDALRAFLKERLSSVKVPKCIHLRAQLELLANGKLNRPAMRQALIDLATNHTEIA